MLLHLVVWYHLFCKREQSKFIQCFTWNNIKKGYGCEMNVGFKLPRVIMVHDLRRGF